MLFYIYWFFWFFFLNEAEAEFASTVGRVSGGENGRPEADIQREEVVDNRTVGSDGGGVREARGGVPDRRVVCATLLHDFQCRERIGG